MKPCFLQTNQVQDCLPLPGLMLKHVQPSVLLSLTINNRGYLTCLSLGQITQIVQSSAKGVHVVLNENYANKFHRKKIYFTGQRQICTTDNNIITQQKLTYFLKIFVTSAPTKTGLLGSIKVCTGFILYANLVLR